MVAAVKGHRMDDSLNLRPASIESISARYNSSDFLLMALRLFAAREQDPTLRLWHCDLEDGPKLLDWLHAEQVRTEGDGNPYFYVVSGMMNPRCWNKYNFDQCGKFLENPSRYGSFVMKGMTSPFVSISRKNLDPDGGVAVFNDGERLGNNLFSQFYEAARRGDRRFCLYRMENRLACCWVACGGRMALGDLCTVGETGRRYEKIHQFLCVEGTPELIAAIAEREFQHNVALAANAAHMYSLTLENMSEKAREVFAANSQVAPSNGLPLIRLKPDDDDFSLVHHFSTPMYKGGNFLLGTVRIIARTIVTGKEFEKEWIALENDSNKQSARFIRPLT